MDFRDLTYVLAIARHQNITRAAEALFITQPTLSKFLSSLEDELGLKLFQRAGGRYVLTYAGERYVEKAEAILRIKSQLDAELADIVKRDVGVLNVAFPTMRCTYMLPAVLPAFEAKYPNITVKIHEGNSSRLEELLLNRDVEIAFFTEPYGRGNPQITYEVLGVEELLICARKDHPIGRFAKPNPASRYPRLELSQLQNERLIIMQNNQRTGQIMSGYLKETGLEWPNVLRTSSLPAIIDLVAEGYGVSFIFDSHLAHHQRKGPIQCFSFGEPAARANFVVASLRGTYLPRPTRAFIEIVRGLCQMEDVPSVSD